MYRIKLNQFEGPLDLLLFFIHRDELDIYDIPIASIADEFLEYVRVMTEIDLDVAGDFVYFASVLINIKARMLLPSPQTDEEGEIIDPRKELVERLLEYVRFKEASQELSVLADRRSDQYTRGLESAVSLDAEITPVEDLVDATVFDLISALRRVLTEDREEIVHEIHAEQYTLEEQMAYLRAALVIKTQSSFVKLVQGKSRSFIITTFLAILELARTQEIDILLSGDPTDFQVVLKSPVSDEPLDASDTPTEVQQ